MTIIDRKLLPDRWERLRLVLELSAHSNLVFNERIYKVFVSQLRNTTILVEFKFNLGVDRL